ncbi:MAG: UDP-glucose 4-epimerase GalE [Candidatus Omnitrophica bacterium]|nr:UDP-glucose 4-epimerase GalE [Candidatus Omnitrophota bacterium]
MTKKSGSDNNILLIGGAGYIGSHMLRVLLENRVTPVVFDNLSSGLRHFIPQGVPFFKGDLKDLQDIRTVLKKYKITTVMHFASSIIVPESVADPVKYYENNVSSFVNLVKAMREAKVQKMIFSSTAAVYAEPKKVPIPEDAELVPSNPYGQTKLMCEQILRDTAAAHKDFSYVIFRYFNVAGAYDDGGIGESHEPETHLIPIVLETALGRRDVLKVFGDDYDTPDGTCVRDYIHVQDLAEAHYLALKAIDGKARNQIFNLGSQKGFSVKQVITAVRRVTGKDFPVKMFPRRPGDGPRLIASSQKAKKILGWVPKRGLDKMISSAWEWEKTQ